MVNLTGKKTGSNTHHPCSKPVHTLNPLPINCVYFSSADCISIWRSLESYILWVLAYVWERHFLDSRNDACQKLGKLKQRSQFGFPGWMQTWTFSNSGNLPWGTAKVRTALSLSRMDHFMSISFMFFLKTTQKGRKPFPKPLPSQDGSSV